MSGGDWLLIGLALLLTVGNPVLWIRAAMLLLGPARRTKFLTNLRGQIAAEPNERARNFEMLVFRIATGEQP